MLAIVKAVCFPTCFPQSTSTAACIRVKGRSSLRHNTSIARCGMLLPDLENQHQTFSRKLPLQETLMVLQIPPPDQFIGPRIEHIQVTSDGLLSEAIAAALELPQWFVLELIRFGAVHHSAIMPPPAAAAAPHMSAAHLEHIKALRAQGIARLGRDPKLQHPKRVLQDVAVGPGAYVRVHVHPKRFPAAHSVDWQRRIIADNPQFVVVDKPPGVQVPSTVDNVLESVVSCTAAALGLPGDALLNTHRLDAGTSGVVVLAKSSSFAAWFNSLLRHKPDNIVKVYRCLSRAPPPRGLLVHYAKVHSRGKGEPAHTRMTRPQQQTHQAASSSSSSSRNSGCDNGRDPGRSPNEEGLAQAAGGDEGARCELVVLQVEAVSLTGQAAAEWGPTAFESTLQLITGRTHQIRAQLAAEGCPLLGDTLYEALYQRWRQHEEQQQQPAQQQPEQQLQQEQQLLLPASKENERQLDQVNEQQQQQQPAQQQPEEQHTNRWQQAAGQQPGGAEWARSYQLDPLKPIALQAHLLQVRDEEGRMKQQVKWWQAGQQLLQQQQVPQAWRGVLPPRPGGDEEWIEFQAGVPWWRQKD